MAEYIEREAVLKKMRGLLDLETTSSMAALGIVERTPTADVVEVKRGEWVDKPTGAYGRWQSWCTACGKHSGIGGIESNRHKPYCPNCGAMMKERKE